MTDFERDILRYFDKNPNNIIILNTYVTKKIFKTKTFKNLKNEDIELYPVKFKRGGGSITVKSTIAYVTKNVFDTLSIGCEVVVIYPKLSMESFRLVPGTYNGRLFETINVREVNVDGVEERNILKKIKQNETNTIILYLLSIFGLVLSYGMCSLLIALGIIGFMLCFGLIGFTTVSFMKLLKLKKLFLTPSSLKVINAKVQEKDSLYVNFYNSKDFKIFRYTIFGGNATEDNNECFIILNKIDGQPLMIMNGQYTGGVYLTNTL